MRAMRLFRWTVSVTGLMMLGLCALLIVASCDRPSAGPAPKRQAASKETVKCSRCGHMQTKFLPDGTQRTGCEKCGYTLVVFDVDKGPDKIDRKVLATYPEEMQRVYNGLFSKRCSRCHTLARPINRVLTPTQWEEYVKRMMRKPGSGIKPQEAKQIWEFLVYDTAKRKKSELDKIMARLAPSRREKEKQVMERIVNKVEGQS